MKKDNHQAVIPWYIVINSYLQYNLVKMAIFIFYFLLILLSRRLTIKLMIDIINSNNCRVSLVVILNTSLVICSLYKTKNDNKV